MVSDDARPAGPAPDPDEVARNRRQADVAFAGVVTGALTLVAVLYTAFPGLVVMLLLAALLSYALLPLVDRLDTIMPRSLAVIAVALGLLGLLAGVVLSFAPAVAEQVAQLPQVVTDTSQTLSRLWERLLERMPRAISNLLDSWLSGGTSALRRALPAPDRLAGLAASAASGITAVASAIIFVPVFVFLMLRSFHSFMERLARAIPPRWKPYFQARVREADAVLSGFVRGQLLIALILAITYGTAFSLLGIPLGLVVGLIAGFGELIPYVGGAVALVVGSLMALVGGQPLDVLWVAAIYFVVQAIQGGVVGPWIVGSKANIGPVAVIVALIVGAQILGFVGLLVAVPAAALLKVAVRSAFDAYRQTRFYRRASA